MKTADGFECIAPGRRLSLRVIQRRRRRERRTAAPGCSGPPHLLGLRGLGRLVAGVSGLLRSAINRPHFVSSTAPRAMPISSRWPSRFD